MGPARAGLLCALSCALFTTPAASASSLEGGPGPRPGPAILYAPLADAPQLDNAPHSVWRAKPILVSGAEAYRNGVFLYQDFLYDDHGAHEQLDPSDPRITSATFSQPNGTYTYPTNPAYANNAADIVEFRVKPLARATAFRITLNTMHDPTLVAFTIALGGSEGSPQAFPYGANVSAPADAFLTVHPGAAGKRMVGEIQAAGMGGPLGATSPSVIVDTRRRQIEVDVPDSDWNPGKRAVRMEMGVGLWDKATHRYLLPGPTASATTPGGGGTAQHPPAFFNVAFRTHEPMTDLHELGSVPAAAQSPTFWRDADQGQALAAGDIGSLAAFVDFAKLRAGVTDDSGVPRTGPMDRIMASHFEPAQGVDYAGSCTSGAMKCEYQGRLEPYAIYVPSTPPPARGYGLTLLLHALFTNYNLYLSSRNQSEFADAGAGSIVVTPESRAPDGDYAGLAEADVFEAWADVAAHYRLDPGRAAVTGYSMGGIGTFKLGEQFPDLFGKAFSISGTDQTSMLGNLRNLPIRMWNMVADEEVPITGPEQTAKTLDGLGYRYELDEFAPGEHNTFAVNDEYGPAAAFLASDPLDSNPAHVSYSVDPALDVPADGLVADHAYWVSGMRPRTAGSIESVDAVSHGFGTGGAVPSGTQRGAGTVTGGMLPALAYVSQAQTWGSVPAAPRSDAIDVTASNLAAVTVDPARAHVDCRASLEVKTDGPVKITLAGCRRTVTAGP
ncbi:MAG TPA: alpha/beta hydrolase-fold protein [Solirubrobacteraceae bacterium]